MGWRGVLVAAGGPPAADVTATVPVCAWSHDNAAARLHCLRHRGNDDLYLTHPVL